MLMLCSLGAGFQIQPVAGMNLYSLLPCVPKSAVHVRAHSLDSAEVNRVHTETAVTSNTNTTKTNGRKISSDASPPKKPKIKISHQQLQIHGHHIAITAPSSARPSRKKWSLKSLRIKRSASDTSMKTNLKDKVVNKSASLKYNNNHLQVPGAMGSGSPMLRKSAS